MLLELPDVLLSASSRIERRDNESGFTRPSYKFMSSWFLNKLCRAITSSMPALCSSGISRSQIESWWARKWFLMRGFIPEMDQKENEYKWKVVFHVTDFVKALYSDIRFNVQYAECIPIIYAALAFDFSVPLIYKCGYSENNNANCGKYNGNAFVLLLS